MRSAVFTSISLLLPVFAFAQSSSSGLSSPTHISTTQVSPVQEVGPDLAIQPPVPQTPGQLSANKSLNTSAETPLLTESTGTTGINFSKLITFDEFAQGTVITSNYQNVGILFGGSELKIIDDISSADSPVLGGTPPGGELLDGDITGQFVIPGSTTPAPVYRMTWDIGYLNEVGSVEMEFFGPEGQLLFSIINNQTGFLKYSASGGSIGIASWRFHIIATETAGFGVDNLYFSIPGQDDLDREKGEIACSQGNPVNPGVGNKYQLETDYEGSRPFPLKATRAYNSIGGSWQILPEFNYVPGEVAGQLIRPDGKGLSYFPYGGVEWRTTSPEMTGRLSIAVDESGAVVGWRYTTLDNQVELYDTAGRITSITQRSGISHAYTYTESEITVTHSLGGSLTYARNALGVITGFTDPAGNLYSYSYNANGLITGVSYPDGGGRTYHYEDGNYNDLLTGISDANGDRFATWMYDNNRRAIVSEHNGGAERTTFDYRYTDHPSSPQTVVTNALGKDTSYHYITVNGARKVFLVRGHESANCVAANQSYGFTSKAFIASKTDWKGNVTAYLRNDKGQELSRTEAQGSPQERTITTQWHPTFNLPLKITEPGKETSFSYDAQGNPLGRSIMDTATP